MVSQSACFEVYQDVPLGYGCQNKNHKAPQSGYPPVLKHGLLENPSFIDDFPSYLPPFSSGVFQPRVKTQWVFKNWQILVIDAEGYPTCGNGGPHVATIHYTYNIYIYIILLYIYYIYY